MPEAPRQRRLLRVAWALLAVALLFGLQLGWLDRLRADAGRPGGSSPQLAPTLSAISIRRELTSGGGDESTGDWPAGSGSSAEHAVQCDGPFDIEKVALMFLVRGPIHHEPTWAAWLDDAAEFTPTPAAVWACCNGVNGGRRQQSGTAEGSPSTAAVLDTSNADVHAEYGSNAPFPGEPAVESSSSFTGEAAERRLQGQAAGQRFRHSRRSLQWLRLRRKQRQPSNTYEGIVGSQRLYSVYVHPAPRYPAYSRGHLFHGLEVKNRVKVEWGHHSVTAAMRLLLAAAVADPANQRFQFLDETSIPLYPPHLVWAQFMYETKSRMSACESQVTRVQWLPQLEGPYLKPSMWRKTSQWSMILRHHAEILVEDTQVWDAITPLCEAREFLDPATNTSKPYPCISDEHYFATVLAAAGLSNETTCAGNAMHVDWARAPGNGSPFTYWMKDASLETINTVRGQKGKCPYMDTIRHIRQLGNFESAATLQRFTCPAESAAAYQMPYNIHVEDMVKCSLFSRKWAFSTRDLVYQALTNSSEPAGVLAPRHAEQRKQEEARAAAEHAPERAGPRWWLRRRRRRSPTA